jgi:hypothetical protein
MKDRWHPTMLLQHQTVGPVLIFPVFGHIANVERSEWPMELPSCPTNQPNVSLVMHRHK